MQRYAKVATYPSICDEWYDSVTNGTKNNKNYFVESRKECIFAARKFMFSGVVHKFQVQKHISSVQKYKFSVRKHKRVRRRKKN